MAEPNGSTASAPAVVREEHGVYGPIYSGTREALIAAGIAPRDALFPGDRPGLRAPQFTDAEGRVWKIAYVSKYRGIFRVQWKVTGKELARRAERHWATTEAQAVARQSRGREIARVRLRLAAVPTAPDGAQLTLFSMIDVPLSMIESMLAPDGAHSLGHYGISIDADSREEVGGLINEIRRAIGRAQVRFDPSARESMQRRLTELRAQEAREDTDFRDALGQILTGKSSLAEQSAGR